MSLKEQIEADLGSEYQITKVEVERDEDKGHPGTRVTLTRKRRFTNTWFFAAINHMAPENMVIVMRSYLKNDKR